MGSRLSSQYSSDKPSGIRPMHCDWSEFGLGCILVLLFWFSVLMIVYSYLIYPGLLWILTFWKRLPCYPEFDDWPTVSMILAAHNEAAVIREKIENSLALDYPREKLQVIVVSDCSTDGTDEIVGEYADRGIELYRMETQSGKTTAQNAGVRLASGEILVFSDANSIYAIDALKELLRPLSEPHVGCVCGELRYLNPEDQGAGKGEGIYWRYERFMKSRESLLCSTLGANGSIYALRRELFEELEGEIISDFIMPIRIWRKGHRVVYAPGAIATENSGASFQDEFRRRRRIIARSINSLWSEADVLNPFSQGIFAVQMISHKVLRWLVPIFLIVIFTCNIFLAGKSPYYLFFILQLAFYGLALLGNVEQRYLGRRMLLYLPAYFCATNFGALLGLWSFLTKRKHTVWQPMSRG